MKGYKAFAKGLICMGKKYAENTIFEEKGAESCCNKGVMHFCETPLDTLDYYQLIDENGDMSEWAEVEALDKVLSNGNKRATKKLRIGAKLSFKKFVEASVEVLLEKTKPSGDSSQLAASGDSSKLAASGKHSIAAGIGINNVAKASLGSWIVLAEWKNKNGNMIPVNVKAVQVDGETIKENVFYKMVDGKFKEVEP